MALLLCSWAGWLCTLILYASAGAIAPRPVCSAQSSARATLLGRCVPQPRQPRPLQLCHHNATAPFLSRPTPPPRDLILSPDRGARSLDRGRSTRPGRGARRSPARTKAKKTNPSSNTSGWVPGNTTPFLTNSPTHAAAADPANQPDLRPPTQTFSQCFLPETPPHLHPPKAHTPTTTVNHFLFLTLGDVSMRHHGRSSDGRPRRPAKCRRGVLVWRVRERPGERD